MTPAEFHDAALARTRGVLVDLDETFRLLLAALLVGGNVLRGGRARHRQDAHGALPGATPRRRRAGPAIWSAFNASSSRRTSCRPTSWAPACSRWRPSTFIFRRGPIFANVVRGRRGQPRAGQDPIGAARSDGGAPGDGRGPAHAAAARVSGDRHAEPGRVRRHLSAAGGAARPLSVQAAGRLRFGRRRARRSSSATTPVCR